MAAQDGLEKNKATEERVHSIVLNHRERLGVLSEDWDRCREIIGEVNVN